MTLPHDWLQADWPAALRVRTCVTTRSAGSSQPPFDCFNLGDHVGDAPQQVQANRDGLAQQLNCTPVWLEQVHGIAVVEARPGTPATADACWTRTPGVACAIMTADCLPVLFTDRAGTVVAAAHAGWRSLVAGVLEQTVAAMQVNADEVLVWLGPAIGPQVFEVGPEVREAFVALHGASESAFVPSARAGHWLADLYQLARIRLATVGVQAVYGGGECTLSDTRFYSYRRNAVTGRMASLVWLADSVTL
ncbi:MAG: peptidoglycan editing factor PgeF [Thiopseudomonas sp.]|nr:peptidoglycan editing factor PgeF [Thiopseudomonas sp.]